MSQYIRLLKVKIWYVDLFANGKPSVTGRLYCSINSSRDDVLFLCLVLTSLFSGCVVLIGDTSIMCILAGSRIYIYFYGSSININIKSVAKSYRAVKTNSQCHHRRSTPSNPRVSPSSGHDEANRYRIRSFRAPRSVF